MFGKKQEERSDLEIFTIFDSKSQSYGNPVFVQNKNVLQRDIINMMKDPQQAQNLYILNAEDYSVFKIGTYSKTTGLVVSQNLEHVCNMHDLRAMAGPPKEVLN